MRRPLALLFFALCLLFATAFVSHADARTLNDPRQQQAAEKQERFIQRQQMRLERKRQLQEVEQQKREAREAQRTERLKAIAEARAAKEEQRKERLQAREAAKAAKLTELAEKKAALETAKQEALREKEAKLAEEKAAKEKEQTASIFTPPPEAAPAPLTEEAALHQEWEQNLDGWIDTDEGTRPIARQEVELQTKEAPGTVIIDTTQRRLYFVLSGNRAMQYGIGVGRPGFDWMGVKSISRKEEWPDWRPPEMMIARRPDLPRFMPGGPTNPMGARAMYLGSTLYRIHGSNEPESIGQAVSSGCFRMVNADVIDLYARAQIGAKVIVR